MHILMWLPWAWESGGKAPDLAKTRIQVWLPVPANQLKSVPNLQARQCAWAPIFCSALVLGTWHVQEAKANMVFAFAGLCLADIS